MGGESILVVEDKVVTARHIQSTLMGLGYKAEHLATSGEEAIEKALENKPDLILMDIMLGEGMDGVQAAQHVRSHLDVPIVFLSAYSDKSILDRAKMTEPFGYLIKPFRPEELRTTIEVALFKHKMESRLRESEQKYRDLVELMPQFVYEIDATGRFTFVNENGLKLSGYQQQDLADGTSLFDILSSEDSRRVAEDFARALNGTNVVESQYTLMTKDGTAMPIVVHAGPIVENGFVIGIRGCATDISQIKAAQRTLQDAAATLEREVEDRTASLRIQLEKLEALNAIGREVNSSLSLNDVLSNTRDVLASVMKTEMVMIFLKQGDDLIFQDTLMEGSDVTLAREQSIRVGECLCGRAASDKIPVYSADIQKDPRCTIDECKSSGVKSFAALPLKSGNSVMGVLGLASRSERDFSHERIFLDTISVQIALGIHNARLYKESEQHAKELEKKIDELEESRLALQKSEDLLSKSQEMGHVGSWQFELSTRRFICSDEACRIFGVQPQGLSVSLEDFLEVVHPDDLASVDTAYSGSLKDSGGSYEVEHRIVRKGSSDVRYLHEKWGHVRDSSGRSLYAVGIVQDITDRKRAEKRLHESEKRLELALDAAEQGIWDWDLETGQVVCNRRWAEMLSMTNDQIEYHVDLWRDLVHPDDLPRLLTAWDEHLQGVTPSYESEYRVRDGSGSWKWVSSHGRVSDRDNYEKPLRLTGTTIDITERKKSEEALRESEEKYRALFEESKDAVYIATRDGILIDANQAFRDLFGFSRDETQNLDILRVYSDPDDRKRFQEEVERKGSVKDYEMHFRKKGGTEIECLLTSVLRRDKNGIIVGYQGIIRDVTGFNKIQRQLLQAQKMEAIGTLAGGIAHDFNNLLQAILGYTEMLLGNKGPIDPERKKLEVIQHAALDGADLVSRILTLSRKGVSNVNPIELNVLVRRVEKLLRRTLPKMIQIDLLLADDLRIIEADSGQIEQIILNLGVNAHHAMPEGGRLVIETSNVSLGEEYAITHIGAKPGKYVLWPSRTMGPGCNRMSWTEYLSRFSRRRATAKVLASDWPWSTA